MSHVLQTYILIGSVCMTTSELTFNSTLLPWMFARVRLGDLEPTLLTKRLIRSDEKFML